MILRRIYLAVFMAVFLTTAVFAHEGRPLFIEISEISADIVRVAWKMPPLAQKGVSPAITLGPPCQNMQQNNREARGGKMSLYVCPVGLAGVTVRIAYPLYNPSISTLFHVAYRGGETRYAVLDPSQTVWKIPGRENFSNIIKTYFVIGVGHISGGMDHLLFLAGLLYMARGFRRLLVTVTSFTIAHTITIFLTVLGGIGVSVAAVEVVIALSVVFVAAEIARDNRDNFSWRYPAIVAGGFGLVHGMGFATALGETGLPQTERISALVFFNMGVEFGQIVIIGLVFTSVFLIRRYAYGFFHMASVRFPLRAGFAYSLGMIAAYWFVARLFAVL